MELMDSRMSKEELLMTKYITTIQEMRDRNEQTRILLEGSNKKVEEAGKILETIDTKVALLAGTEDTEENLRHEKIVRGVQFVNGFMEGVLFKRGCFEYPTKKGYKEGYAYGVATTLSGSSILVMLAYETFF